MSKDKVQFWVGGKLVGSTDTTTTTADTTQLTAVTAERDQLKARVSELEDTQKQGNADEQELITVKAERDTLTTRVAELEKDLEAARKQANDAVQDAALAPYTKGGGHYEFPAATEGGEPIKVRGQGKAWEHYQTIVKQ